MAVIVDGYNVLCSPMPPALAGLNETGLCRALARSIWRSQRIVVVCDGVCKPLGPSVSPVAEVELIYSGRGRSADQVIQEMVEADSAPRRLLVVSSDREIQKAARRRRAKVLASAELIRVLASPPPPMTESKPGSRVGNATLSAAEVKRWLEQFGFDPKVEEDSPDEAPWPPKVD